MCSRRRSCWTCHQSRTSGVEIATWIASIATLIATAVAVWSAIVAKKERKASARSAAASAESAAKSLAAQQELADALGSIEEMQRADRRVQWQIANHGEGLYELLNVGKVDAHNVRIDATSRPGATLKAWPEHDVTISRDGGSRKFRISFRGTGAMLTVRILCAEDPEGQERELTC